MTFKEVQDQMIINAEIGHLSPLKVYQSYSSDKPDERYFVKSDNAFTKRARLLQAVRRWQTGADCGCVTKNGIKYYHPNLAVGGDTTGCNFLHHDTFEYAKDRVNNKKSYETINADRLFNNFLSSQPMAFNLFYPLMQIAKVDVGQIVLADVVRGILDKENKLGIDRITKVCIEFIPKYYRECLNDKTAMDACFRYESDKGKKGIIAIETKYTDALGMNQASDPSIAIEVATKRCDIPDIFTDDGKKRILRGDIKLSQIYRNFLLTEMVRVNEQLDDSLSIVLVPKDNDSNKKEEERLKGILCDNFKYKFQTVTLEKFVDSIIEKFPDEDIFKKFKHRYLDFRPADWLLKQ